MSGNVYVVDFYANDYSKFSANGRNSWIDQEITNRMIAQRDITLQSEYSDNSIVESSFITRDDNGQICLKTPVYKIDSSGEYRLYYVSVYAS